MLTIQRMYEIVRACDGLISSPNITSQGKLNALQKRDEMLRLLSFTEGKEQGEGK